ncbi:MAG: IS66 family insertion sequence element accessory protein TnpB [Gammaproteobacteria bacterium]|nr:IS66 family insertion sequence element accessory protein TnpB [Gammaproteobacteria bacterium]
MLVISANQKIYLGLQPIDFRKGIDGIKQLCETVCSQQPYSGHLFVFINRRRTSIKVLSYDGQGFWLCQKRLSSGRFRHWPNQIGPMKPLAVEQLQVLLRNGNLDSLEVTPNWQTLSAGAPC